MNALETSQIQLQVGSFRLNSVNVSIPPEKMTAIVGPNGSGKSTLLKIISRLLQPDGGQVLLYGKSIKEYKTVEFAQALSMLTQSKSSIPDLTVKELISYGRSPYKRMFDRMNKDDEQIIDWAMNITGTKRHEQRMFHTLSGGEQQKVRIAMALAQKTNIILLDEPTTFLDISHQLDVMEMLQRINQELKITVVMVLHDLQQAACYCQYMIAMKDGKVQIAGNPKEIINVHFLNEVYKIEARVTFEDQYPIIIPLKTINNH
ncbi:ABC transporter ATP-binding protein [Paenibacillus doosanensis]|uniref:ABC transporter ATP-binding protein n=1 Tax=Paenibacillus doosanensis TaxID=1229154 RepID=UPI00217FB841|nr:ABC transporter ATP-binding protein [Paenibacillus doosanensis]MCS7464743.1 ABC transporter ATP-binding protein [Paenibacillus doosanensis]